MKKLFAKFLPIFLIISMILPSFTVFSSGDQENTEGESPNGVTWEDVLAGVASPYDYFGELDPATVPDAVGMETALSRVHIERLYEEETGLNDAVFLNPDGSRTLYMFDYPIKYIDDKGKVRDISLEIADSELESAAFESVATDSVTTFSMRASDGINLSGNGTSITMVPIIPQSYTRSTLNANSADSTVKRIDKKTVSYYYDDSTEIEYSLTYTGFKEDIVVNEYTGQTEYEFILYTDGNSLVCEDGSYFVVDEDGAVKATVGDIIIFTADDQNNTLGSMRSEVIEENEIYALTVVVDEDFLRDEKTAYPIRIDPTVEISYSNDGAGAILDMTINSLDTSNGYSTSIHVGKRDVYGISRILMKFPGLDLDEMPSAAQITDATVSIRDIMCQSEELMIECCVFTGNVWNEDTVGWTQANGSSYSTDMFYERAISYSEGKLQTAQHRYEFNITTAVKGWKSGLFDREKGIIFKAADEVENGSTYIYKTFGSYNRSSNQPMLSVTYSTTTTNIYADDTYYVNNWLFGKYLRYVSGTTDTVEGKSGLLANLQDTIKWELRKADNGYLIRSADDTTKYLTAYNTSSSQVAIRTHTEGVVSQLYYWDVSVATGGGVLIKNKLNGKYLCLSNESVSLVSSPGAVGSENYTASVWRLASDSFYGNTSAYEKRELSTNSHFDDYELGVGQSMYFDIESYYSNEFWDNTDTDFTYSISSNQKLDISSGRLNAISRGVVTVIATHKVTNLVKEFEVFVKNTLLTEAEMETLYTEFAELCGEGYANAPVYNLFNVSDTIEKIVENDQIITEYCNEYRIPKEFVQSVLFREIWCYSSADGVADTAVMEYYWLLEGMILTPTTVLRDDSSTGLGQIFAATAITALNHADDRGFISLSEQYDHDDWHDVWEVWGNLHDDDNYNIMCCALVILDCQYEYSLTIPYDDFFDYSSSQIKTILARYNGTGDPAQQYGEYCYEYYEIFEEVNK